MDQGQTNPKSCRFHPRETNQNFRFFQKSLIHPYFYRAHKYTTFSCYICNVVNENLFKISEKYLVNNATQHYTKPLKTGKDLLTMTSFIFNQSCFEKNRQIILCSPLLLEYIVAGTAYSPHFRQTLLVECNGRCYCNSHANCICSNNCDNWHPKLFQSQYFPSQSAFHTLLTTLYLQYQSFWQTT